MPDEARSTEDLEERIKEREQRISKMKQELARADAWDRNERRDRIATRVKLTAIGIGALIVLAGGVWAVGKAGDLVPANGCTFHEHATFRVVVDGRELSYQNPRFDMKYMAMRAHLHQPNDYQIHLEGSCATVSQFFDLIETRLDSDHMRLDDVMHGGRDLRPDGNNSLQFYLYHAVEGNGTWENYPDLPGTQLRDKQKMLIMYGNYTTEEIATFQARVPNLAG